jgi:hypothetical protein
MATWTNERLDRIGYADELQLTSLRDSPSPFESYPRWSHGFDCDEIASIGNVSSQPCSRNVPVLEGPRRERPQRRDAASQEQPAGNDGVPGRCAGGRVRVLADP